MLTKVEPAEKGIPHFKQVYVSDIKAVGVKKIVNAAGLKESLLEDFHYNNVQVQGNSAGAVSFAKGWVFNNVLFKGADGAEVQVSNSENMKTQ
jgi:hypothetical protein